MLLPGAVIPWRLNSPISFHKFTSFFTNKKQIRFWEVKMVRKREWKDLWKWICFIYSFGMRSDNILCKLGHTFFKLQFTKGERSTITIFINKFKKKEQFYSTKRRKEPEAEFRRRGEKKRETTSAVSSASWRRYQEPISLRKASASSSIFLRLVKINDPKLKVFFFV